MADDRRIIISSYALVKESADAEEAIPSKWKVYTGNSMTGAIGGKGIVTDLNDNQSDDGWTSMFHQQDFWEDRDNNWEAAQDYWDGQANIAYATGTQLYNDVGDLSFAYIKNTGSYEAKVSLKGDGTSSYGILIPSGGSVYFRSGSNALECNEVYARCAESGQTTTVEFVIAKK